MEDVIAQKTFDVFNNFIAINFTNQNKPSFLL